MFFLEAVMKVYFVNGFNPFRRSTKFDWYDLRKWCLLIFVFYSLIPQVTFTVSNFNDILKSAKSMGSVMITFSGLSKILVHICYRDQIKTFIEAIDRFIGHRKREAAEKFVKVENRMNKLFRIYNNFCWICIFVYGLWPAFLQTYLYTTGQATEDTFVLPFDTEYFFDSSRSGVYQICYLSGFISLMFAGQWAVCADSLFLGYCLYIGEMYGSLDINLRELNSFYENEDGDDQRTNEFSESLKSLLEDHNQILTIVGQLNEIYGPLILIQFLSSQIMISILLFQSFHIFDAEHFLFFCYLNVTLYQLFIYCYGGAVLSYASQKFAANVYDLNWYQFPLWAQKCVLLILGVAQKTQKVGVYLFQSCDLTTFCQILKFVYLTYTVLNSLK